MSTVSTVRLWVLRKSKSDANACLFFQSSERTSQRLLIFVKQLPHQNVSESREESHHGSNEEGQDGVMDGNDAMDTSDTTKGLLQKSSAKDSSTPAKQGSAIGATSAYGTGSSGMALLESDLQLLISKCKTNLVDYEALYMEFGIVVCKEDIDKEGQARLKSAAAVLTEDGLKLSRFGVKNVESMTIAQMDQANNVVMHCKWQREFAKDACPELTFSSRALTGEFIIRIAFKLTTKLQWR